MNPICDTCDREQVNEGPCEARHLYDPQVRLCPGSVSWQATAEKMKVRWELAELKLAEIKQAAEPLVSLAVRARWGEELEE